MTTTGWKIVQVFNNNVVLAENPGKQPPQAVLVGTGIGFGARRGQHVDASAIHEVFAPQMPGANEQLARLLSELPPELLDLARELADVASLLCGFPVTDAFVIMLADHINAAIDRTLQGIALPNPMQWEIRQLYPREYEFGVRALALIKQSTGVQLAADEAISLAQHAVNAQFTLAGSSTQRSPADMMSGMAQTAQFTQLLATILDIVENALDVPLDRNSMATARFITHLRFLLHRLVGERGTPHEPEPGMLAMADSMMKQYPQAYRIAGLVVIKLESTLDTKCSEDEILYLTLHVARLMMKA